MWPKWTERNCLEKESSFERQSQAVRWCKSISGFLLYLLLGEFLFGKASLHRRRPHRYRRPHPNWLFRHFWLCSRGFPSRRICRLVAYTEWNPSSYPPRTRNGIPKPDDDDRFTAVQAVTGLIALGNLGSTVSAGSSCITSMESLFSSPCISDNRYPLQQQPSQS